MDYRYAPSGPAHEGGYLPGVPARHLKDEELAAIAARRGQTVKALEAELEACGLYKTRGEGSHKSAKAKADPEPEAEAEPEDTMPSVLPTQTGPDGAMVEPAPYPFKQP